MRTKLVFNNEKISESTEILRALAHPLRLKILEFIDQNEEINVNKIYNTLNLEQSITSQHLKILRLAKLVDANRDGKYIYYSINYDRLHNSIESLENFKQSIANQEIWLEEEGEVVENDWM